jgi:hypothetical protein
MSINHLSAQNDLSMDEKTDFLLRQFFSYETSVISVANMSKNKGILVVESPGCRWLTVQFQSIINH